MCNFGILTNVVAEGGEKGSPENVAHKFGCVAFDLQTKLEVTLFGGELNVCH